MVFLSTPLQIALAILLLYLFTAYLTTTFPTLSGKRILLLIAHPDDEAMFFGPTLRYLTHPSLGNQIIVLCFSSGDADGLGHIRKSELQKSALQLGITSTEHVVVIEDEKFPDSMTANWDPKAIGAILLRYFAPKIAHTPSTAALTAYIDGSCTSPLDPARCRK
jgi:N-acetylglucosaminylphosphatidylinositol deacetylase